MIKFLLKSTNEYRLETIEDVKTFEQELRDRAAKDGYTISTFSYARKEVKASGEVVDEYYVVKVAAVFNTAKDPENPWNGVEYTKSEVSDVWED